MSFTPCRGITQNITNNCQPRIKGFEQLGGIVDKRFIIAIGVVNNGIRELHLYNGFPIYNPRQSPKPFNGYKVEFNPETNCYKKTIQFYYEGIGAANAKNIIDSLKDNEFMIVIERKEKLNYAFIFIGAQNGLHVTEMVEDEDTGYWLITMETEEPASEISTDDTKIDMEDFINGEEINF